MIGCVLSLIGLLLHTRFFFEKRSTTNKTMYSTCPNRSNHLLQNARVPKFSLMTFRSCLALGNLVKGNMYKNYCRIILHIPQFLKPRVLRKSIWRILNTIIYIWRGKMLGYLSSEIICSSELTFHRATCTLSEDRSLLPQASLFYVSFVFSNARRVLSQCNTRLRLLYLLNILKWSVHRYNYAWCLRLYRSEAFHLLEWRD